MAVEPTQVQVEAARGQPAVLASEGATTLRFVSGYLVEVDQLPTGVTMARLRDALAEGHPSLTSYLGKIADLSEDRAAALNAAFMADGAILRVEAGTQVEKSLHLDFRMVGEASAVHARVLVIVEKGAKLTLVESHAGPAEIAHQPNIVVEVSVDDGAKVEHVRLNALGERTLSLSTLGVSLGEASEFDSLSMTLSPGVSRHNVHIRFAGERARAGIRGATLLLGRQHADTTLVVDHAVPNGSSRELFKTVIDDEGVGVFQGKIIVRPDAQKTDGRMMSAALLLAEGASMYNKPELEIFADDVQCGHGATVAQPDENLLFYIMARGLPRKEAEALLVQAFVGEAIEEGVSDEALREALIGLVERWLAERARRHATIIAAGQGAS